MLATREHGVGVVEVHEAKRVRVGDDGPDRPLGDEPRRADVVVVVSQEADVDAEVFNEVGEDTLTHGGVGRRVDPHE